MRSRRSASLPAKSSLTCGLSAIDVTSASTSVSGGAVRITWHGALRVTYSVTFPTNSAARGSTPPSSGPPLIREGRSAASTITSTPRRVASLHDRLTGRARTHGRGGDLDALVLLADLLGAGEDLAGALQPLGRDRGVDRL